MTLYRDMSNRELVTAALDWKSGRSAQEAAAKRLLYALAKRLEETSKPANVVCPSKRDIAAVNTLEAKGYEWRGGEQWAPPLGKIPDHLNDESGLPPPNVRPTSLVDLYDQKGLSVEVREWLTKHRPETWRECLSHGVNVK